MLVCLRRCLLIFFTMGISMPVLLAQSAWPQIVAGEGYTVQLYEPQPEKLTGTELRARAAVSMQRTSEEPVFGVMWFDAGLDAVSNNNGVITGMKVLRSKFAEDDVESNQLLKAAVEGGVPELKISLDLGRVREQLQQEQSIGGEESFKNDAPKIYYRDVPSTLIVLEGEPVEQQDEDLKMIRVVNSPYLIVKNPEDKKYYLYGGALWYVSPQVKAGWRYSKNIPARIRSIDAALKEEAKKADKKEEDVGTFTTATNILVSTEPAELIQTEGRPTFKAVPGSDLLYVDNSLDEIFKDVASQKNFILIAGRWYSSAKLEGPWQFVSSDALPASFAQIPKGSEKDGVLANIAGTQEAEDAVVDAAVPQTAKVDRKSATCEVSYDGAPKFVPIQNTRLSLAENSSSTVMLAPNNNYYALSNGIWFISTSAYGPWEVANERPSDVEKIPASSSAYNARFVQVYYTTPQYVYVGYTPGYLGCYVYRRTVVWGTGWRYRPWHGHYYYPRPYTWGFGMHYSPWTGWNICYGLGFNWNWNFYWSHHHAWGGGWWGPPMYRPPYRPWGWNGGYYSNRPNRPVSRPRVVTNRPVNWNQSRPVARPAVQNNIYVHNRAAITRDKVQRPVVRPAVPPNPGSRPGVTRPTNPVTKPTRPVTRPTQPVTKPVQPVVRPRPVQPGTRPVQPGTKPSTPARPQPKPQTKPAIRPVSGAKQTARPAAKPAPAPKPVSRSAN